MKSRRRYHRIVLDASRGIDPRDAFGQPSQTQQQEHRGHGLDDKLRQGEIGRGQPDEADAGDEAGAAEQDQRREAMKLGLIGGAEGAGDPDRPEQREGRGRDRREAASDHEPARIKRHQRGDESCARQELQLWLETPRAEVVLKPSCQPPGQGDETRSKIRWPLIRRSRGGPSRVSR